jgi:hypothetical protein
MFAALPHIEAVPPSQVSYLFRREGPDVATIRLKDWQRELWQTLHSSTDAIRSDASISEQWALQLVARTDTSMNSARAAIDAAIRLFKAEGAQREGA